MIITINGVTYSGEEAERRSVRMLQDALEPVERWTPPERIELPDEPKEEPEE